MLLPPWLLLALSYHFYPIFCVKFSNDWGVPANEIFRIRSHDRFEFINSNLLEINLNRQEARWFGRLDCVWCHDQSLEIYINVYSNMLNIIRHGRLKENSGKTQKFYHMVSTMFMLFQKPFDLAIITFLWIPWPRLDYDVGLHCT